MANICVIGAGYVRLATAAGFTDPGHQVSCLDIDERKIRSLESGNLTIFEPGLYDLFYLACWLSLWRPWRHSLLRWLGRYPWSWVEGLTWRKA